MKFHDIFGRGPREDWEFDVLGIYNFRKPGPFQELFDWVQSNDKRVAGDYVEAGVFRGRSLLSMGLFLKEIGSEKVVYGYDTFEGFPHRDDPQDRFSEFHALRQDGLISEEHYLAAERNWSLRESITSAKLDYRSISSSNDFSSTSKARILEMANFLGLENIRLVQGSFAETMVEARTEPRSISVALLDCDLYSAYVSALNFIWPRLAPQGFVFLDEYYSLKFPGPRRAIHEFDISEDIVLSRLASEEGEFERWAMRKGNE